LGGFRISRAPFAWLLTSYQCKACSARLAAGGWVRATASRLRPNQVFKKERLSA